MGLAIKNWHARTGDAVIELLQSSPSGLTSTEAQQRLTDYGPNQLPPPPRLSSWRRFLCQFHNILIYVLLGAAVVTAVLAHWVDTAVILAVVIINALIGYLQEGKAEKAMDAIRQMLAPRASVLRDGVRQTVKGETVVPGDFLLLEPGDKVPADLRLLRAHGLQIQEAILTGESIAVEKLTEPAAVDAALGDRQCMAFSGTTVTSGQGMGVVVATGTETEIGRISGLLSGVEPLTTPLVTQMAVFARWLTVFILTVAGLLLGFSHYLLHLPFTELFMAVVGLSVAAIPEGLPAVLTITLAVGVQAMARRNAIVRRLPAIETVGAVSVICSDKTGTLTRNEMSVTSVLSAAQRYQVQGIGYEPSGRIELSGEFVKRGQHQALEQLALAATLCNDAELHNREGSWTVEGDPMEGALLTFACKTGLELEETRKVWARTDVIPFDSKHRFMATLNHDHEGNARIMVKGAPEQILSMCSQQTDADGNPVSLDQELWLQWAEEIAAEGQRVLAFAEKPIASEHTVLEHEELDGTLILLGMVGLIDPPRNETVTAIAECHSASIQVKMITGDHATTATAIGRQIGLENPDNVLTGAEIDRLDDTVLADRVLDTDVFARTSPEHKLRLVMALQAHGLTVAMTGDGVNDAPALKRADAGVAMGHKGSEAAKEASELVLADDNFASITAAVREGRTVYANIKKVISWTLPTNAGEASTIILALLLGMALPITPVQILWVNMITAVTLGIALAFEPTELQTMARPPRPRNEALLSGGLVWHIILVAGLFLGGVFGIFLYAVNQGYSTDLARTIAMNTLVVMEIFHLLYIRNMQSPRLSWQQIKGTKVLWLAIFLVIAGQFAITYLPPLQQLFETESIRLADVFLILCVGMSLFCVIELEKRLRFHLRPISATQQTLTHGAKLRNESPAQHNGRFDRGD